MKHNHAQVVVICDSVPVCVSVDRLRPCTSAELLALHYTQTKGSSPLATDAQRQPCFIDERAPINLTAAGLLTEDKLTNTFASGDKMIGDAPTARTGSALYHRVSLDSVAHSWVLARTPRYTSASTEGGRGVARDTRHHHNDKTKDYSAPPWLPT